MEQETIVIDDVLFVDDTGQEVIGQAAIEVDKVIVALRKLGYYVELADNIHEVVTKE